MRQTELPFVSPSATPKPNPCTFSLVERRTSPFIHCPSKTCKSLSYPISTLPLTHCQVFLIGRYFWVSPDCIPFSLLTVSPTLAWQMPLNYLLVSSFLPLLSQSSRCKQHDQFQIPSPFPSPPSKSLQWLWSKRWSPNCWHSTERFSRGGFSYLQSCLSLICSPTCPPLGCALQWVFPLPGSSFLF